MQIDIGNALASVAKPGISRSALDELDERVFEAHGRIETGIRDRQHGYTALGLPEFTDSERIRETVETVPDHTHIILAGIGGSALGATTIADALGSGNRLHVLDNVDPVHTTAIVENVPLEDAALFVVSRSGQTTETLANAAIVTDAMKQAGIDWSERTLVVTGTEGPLADCVEEHDLAHLHIPAGVPGRFSALSTMGLPIVAALGHDIEAVLAGGRAARESLAPSLFECPGYAFGAISYALANRGVRVNAMMPYAERLETFAEWFAQLWAESLGKDNTGQIPARALGVTDQHSQLQLYRAGPPIIQTSFLAIRNLDGVSIPANPPIDPGTELHGRDLGEVLDIERRSTEASLANAGRPNVRIDIETLDEYALGDLLVSMEAACILAGELFDLDPFDQPAVEWSKRATRALLADEDTTETAAIREKTELSIDPS